ncbi:MAG: hypothetical protein ACI96M_000407 [Candidatus Azotimanducaceae bacterium]|jgi:hypothetical protein
MCVMLWHGFGFLRDDSISAVEKSYSLYRNPWAGAASFLVTHLRADQRPADIACLCKRRLRNILSGKILQVDHATEMYRIALLRRFPSSACDEETMRLSDVKSANTAPLETDEYGELVVVLLTGRFLVVSRDLDACRHIDATDDV